MLYDKMLDNTESIHKIIIQYPEFQPALALDRNGFVEITVLFLYATFRAAFCQFYDTREMFELIRQGVEHLSKKSTLYQKSFDTYWHLFCEIMQNVNASLELREFLSLGNSGQYAALTSLYINYTFEKEDLKNLGEKLQPEFNELFCRLVEFFESFCTSNVQ